MGVGLELSRTLARLHDGDNIAPPRLKIGAVFKLTLPVVDAVNEEVTLLVDSLEQDKLHLLRIGVVDYITNPS
ncbi:MAG: hypothetical protein LAT57_05265 [Balneolales bacterium]|nr:hypothetical protein [Balneolales bacterium]